MRRRRVIASAILSGRKPPPTLLAALSAASISGWNRLLARGPPAVTLGLFFRPRATRRWRNVRTSSTETFLSQPRLLGVTHSFGSPSPSSTASRWANQGPSFAGRALRSARLPMSA
jgi:hypothetical protein